MKRKSFEIDDSQNPIFVTTTIVEWIPVFAEPAIAERTLGLLENSRREIGISVIAFVLMHNHFHGMMQTNQKGDLSRFMLRWKSRSARSIMDYSRMHKRKWLELFKRSLGESGRLGRQVHRVWLPRFDTLPVENETQFYAGLNYIHFNPVRQLLVRGPEDYPYSSFHDYRGGTNGFVNVSRHRWHSRRGLSNSTNQTL